MKNRRYHGKVILFGEYSMIFNSMALMMPYYPAFGEWSSVINRPSEKAFESNKNICKFYDYLRGNDVFRILDLRRLEMELNAGLFFDSNIPLGYGVGSSGALVAAIYDRYKLIEINDSSKLRRFLAQMESYFHGSSSGIDPLQCYIGRPFVLNHQIYINDKPQNSEFQILNDDFLSDDIHIFLIDTKIKSPTAPLVKQFKEMRQNNEYLNKFDNEYIPLVGKCIDCLIERKDDDFLDNLSQLSGLQLELLPHAIPYDFKKYFLKDINDSHSRIKLCGAGGGGYLIGFSNNTEASDRYWENEGQKIIWLK